MSDRSQRKQKRQPRKATRQAQRQQKVPDWQADRDSGLISAYRPDPKPKDRSSGGLIGGYNPPPRS